LHWTVTVTEPRLRLTMENKQTTNPVVMSYRAHPSTLVVNRELLSNGQSASDARSARHIELELPAGMDYQSGDHLGVLPRNNVDVIRRVMARFGLDAGTFVTINPSGGGTYTHLPLGEPAPLLGILGACVALQDVASRSDLAVLARYATDPDEAAQLQAMSGLDEAGREAYRERVAARRRSVLELLGDFPSVDLPFNVYLELLPPIRPRYYSISSSPAVASTCHLTVGVLHGPLAAATGTSRGCLQSPGQQYGAQYAVHLCSEADHPIPPAGQSTYPDDHGRGGHRHGALPWFPARAGRTGWEGRSRREVDPLLWLPKRGA
jgi:cytochrome P450 / NADPH-cytochrome P450 reductase